MIWIYGFAVFGFVCAALIVVAAIVAIRDVDKNGWH